MQLRCVLCHRNVEIDDGSKLAKRARQEGATFAYLCRDCDLRIVETYGIRREQPNPALRNGRRA